MACPCRLLDGDELAREEPALEAKLAGAVLWSETWSTSDPLALTESYARLLEKRGGRLVRGDAMSLKQTGTGWTMSTEDGQLTTENVVVALGPWAPDLLAGLGYRIGMVWKRGYHGHFDLSVPIKPPTA